MEADESLYDVVDLPELWQAERESPESPWTRRAWTDEERRAWDDESS
ncbi:MAG TPA: hypothetical protein VM261_10785 [Kofleriaceae bacterium]|nr:hypothetical protein [Kofleriaceae bacterium]